MQRNGEQLWYAIEVRNHVTEYRLVLSEDTDYVRLETEIGRVEHSIPEFQGLMHDLNRKVEFGKVVVERESVSDAALTDGSRLPIQRTYGVDEPATILFTHQIRKDGVPNSTLIDEMAAFDAGVAQVYTGFTSAVDKLAALGHSTSMAPVPIPAVAGPDEEDRFGWKHASEVLTTF